VHVLDAAPEEGARPAEDGDALGAEEPFELRRLCANLGAAELIGGLWSHHGVHSLLGQHVWQAAAEKDKDAIFLLYTHYTLRTVCRGAGLLAAARGVVLSADGRRRVGVG